MKYLFDNIKPINKEKILKLVEAQTIQYNKDIDILSGPKRKNYIALIESGSVQIVVNDYSGNSMIIEDLKEKDVFGTLLSAIESDECSVITKETTRVTYIDYDSIYNSEIVKNESYVIFIKNLLQIMTSQINSKNDRIQILSKRSTRDKLLEYFKITSQKIGNKRFELPFTFTDLANYLCVDRCAMTREISHLKNEGFIKINNRQVTLLY